MPIFCFPEFGKTWIIQLLNMTNEEIEMFCDEKRGHKGSIMALQRKLLRMDSLKYIRAACRKTTSIRFCNVWKLGRML
jgi:hypothetical protein